jgi:hypothetical protein
MIEVMNPKTLGMEDLNDKFGDNDSDSSLDDMGRRVIKADGHEYLIRCNHRSGLWDIFNPAGGPVPHELKGYFTNIRAAEQALSTYSSRKSHEGIQAKRYHQNLVDKGFFKEEKTLVEEILDTPGVTDLKIIKKKTKKKE